ncbi:MAG: cytochrome P450 [Acidimicrobiia bacterium]
MLTATATTTAQADELIHELVLGKDGKRDPYPYYRRLRELAPVHRSELDRNYYLSGYWATRDLLLHRAVGRSENGRMLRYGINPEQLKRFREQGFVNMLTVNPPDHGRLRKPARGPFLPGRMEGRLAERVIEIVDERLDVVAEMGEADLMKEVAFQLPVTVIGEMVGVPPEDRDEFPELVNEFFRAGQMNATKEDLDRGDRARLRFREYFAGLIERNRRDSGPDLVGALVADGTLNDEELQGTITLIFVAGFITTANLVGNGMLAMFRQPEQLELLWRDPEVVPNAVEEMLRYDSSVQLVERFALEDIEVGDHLIEKGSGILCLLGAANHDPDHFADADRLHLDRANANTHIGFAWGIHHCLGAPLARLEAVTLFARMRERFTRVEPLELDPPRNPSLGIRALKSLPMRFVPA